MTKKEYAVFEALNPFFKVVLKGLRGLVDGKHYFETFADDAVFESRYHFPGWPMTIRGRDNLMASLSGYGEWYLRCRSVIFLGYDHGRATDRKSVARVLTNFADENGRFRMGGSDRGAKESGPFVQDGVQDRSGLFSAVQAAKESM